jgi:hypothetical protein
MSLMMKSTDTAPHGLWDTDFHPRWWGAGRYRRADLQVPQCGFELDMGVVDEEVQA